jgi:hypothetical protein
MSISIQDRLENIDFALKLLLEKIGSCPLGGFHILASAPEYDKILPTTWPELVKKHYLNQVQGFPGRFVFSGYGFRTAMERCGMQDVPDIQQMLGRLSQHLKGSISRTQGSGVLVQSIVNATGLSQGFIINAIEAKLIEYWQKRYGADWLPGAVYSVIVVPANFGLPCI